MVANPPNDQIYDFKGFFERLEGVANTKKPRSSTDKKEDLLGSSGLNEPPNQIESLSLENTMWANTVLASNGFILGMIVYTGNETRA